MKRTPLLLTIGFFLLVAGSITLYQYFPYQEETSIWDLIPTQTVLVYEADDCAECTYKAEGSIIGRMLENLLFDFSDSTKKNLEILSSPKKGNAISLHVTSKDDFDVIYYFPGEQGKQFETTLNSWKGNKKTKFSERELNGTKIQEFSFENRKFSCVQLDKIWVGSFTPFLMEDVIRTFTSDDQSTFIDEVTEVYSLPRIKGDPGNIFIHLKNFISWLKIFPEDAVSLSNLGQASLLDVKNDKHSITLNGFSLTRKGEESLLSYFENQSPVQFVLKQYISNRTIFAIDYGISDGSALYKNLTLSKNKNVQDTLTSLAKIDFKKLFSSLGKEMSELIAVIHSLLDYKHRILYYGPKELPAFTASIQQLHKTPATWTVAPEAVKFERTSQTNNQVLFAEYDAVQADIFWSRNLEKFDASKDALVNMFNGYFGGGMGSIVFQTIRESKALAYSTYAFVGTPAKKEDNYTTTAYVGTQADKLNEAIGGMNELLTDLPKNENSFISARKSLNKDIETERITKDGIIFSYLNAEKKGLKDDIRKTNYEKYKTLKLDDLYNYHQQELSKKAYTYSVVGSEKNIKMDDLKKYGELKKLSLTELFGY